MSPERTSAYRRVTQTLQELGPSKLWDGEQDRIRFAADSLIFSSDLDQDSSAREAWIDAEELCRDLVQSGRWEKVTADRLSSDIRQCGPAVETARLQAA
jgi:hypothetical protein